MKGNEKGITLVTLIVTIIVMLIIVGVTIGIAQRGNLFGKADKAVKEYSEVQIKERLDAAMVSYMKKHQKGKKINTSEYIYDIVDAYGYPNINKETGEVEDENSGASYSNGEYVYVNSQGEEELKITYDEESTKTKICVNGDTIIYKEFVFYKKLILPEDSELWTLANNGDGTYSIMTYNYNNQTILNKYNLTEEELLEDVTIPNKIGDKTITKIIGTQYGASFTYPFTGTVKVSSGLNIYTNNFLRGCNATKIIFEDNVKIMNTDWQMIYGCSKLKEVVIGNNCYANGRLCYENNSLKKLTIGNNFNGANYAFDRCWVLENITLGDNCKLNNLGQVGKNSEKLEITCGANTEIKMTATDIPKTINAKENTSFNYLEGNNITVNGNLVVNSGTDESYNTLSITGANITGNLAVGDKVNLFCRANVGGNATFGNKMKIMSYYNAISVNAGGSYTIGSIIANNTYQGLGGRIPSKVVIDTETKQMGMACFRGSIGMEYLIINPTSGLTIADSIFYALSRDNWPKAVIFNFTDTWTKEQFMNSIGGKINSSWGKSATFYDPIYDEAKNRLIYYTSNLTTDASQVIDLINAVPGL